MHMTLYSSLSVAWGFAEDAVFHASCRIALPHAGSISLVLSGLVPTWQISIMLPSRFGMAGAGWFNGAASGLLVVYTYSS